MSEEQDSRVTAAYRALGAEEPPRALDDAILAASRRPAAKPWTQRWTVPLSLAALLVLSVTVTLRIQREAPELEKPVTVREAAVPSSPPPVAAAEPAPLKLKQEEQFKPAAPERRAEPKAFAEARPVEEKAPAAAPQPQARPEESLARNDAARMESSVAGAAARQSEERVARDAEAASRASRLGPTQALAKRNQEIADTASAAAPAPAARPAAAPAPVAAGFATTPAQELERIAALRAEGKHDEADKALAEFRKRNPDYRISEEMLKKVERR